jgi:hypothetical protein
MHAAALLLIITGVFGVGYGHAQTIFSAPRSGSLTYHDWSFSWNVGSNKEGLELYNVRYKAVPVLYKASMPVVRVKYRGNAESVTSGCGPYQDRLNWSNMIVPSGASSKVVIRHFTGMMELAVYSKIGGYHLYQAWYFHQDGRMQPVLYSSRWSCSQNPKSRRDHRHHPYWRLDFDIETAGGNQVHEFRRVSGSTSHASTLYTSERDASKAASDVSLFWTVGRAATGRHVVVRYHTNELRDGGGSPWFSFSNKDVGARRYRGSEDAGWPFGALGHLGFRSPAENIDRQDVVLWVVGHMTHVWTQADHSNPQWHSSGPVIRAMW